MEFLRSLFSGTESPDNLYYKEAPLAKKEVLKEIDHAINIITKKLQTLTHRTSLPPDLSDDTLEGRLLTHLSALKKFQTAAQKHLNQVENKEIMWKWLETAERIIAAVDSEAGLKKTTLEKISRLRISLQSIHKGGIKNNTKPLIDSYKRQTNASIKLLEAKLKKLNKLKPTLPVISKPRGPSPPPLEDLKKIIKSQIEKLKMCANTVPSLNDNTPQSAVNKWCDNVIEIHQHIENLIDVDPRLFVVEGLKLQKNEVMQKIETETKALVSVLQGRIKSDQKRGYNGISSAIGLSEDMALSLQNASNRTDKNLTNFRGRINVYRERSAAHQALYEQLIKTGFKKEVSDKLKFPSDHAVETRLKEYTEAKIVITTIFNELKIIKNQIAKKSKSQDPAVENEVIKISVEKIKKIVRDQDNISLLDSKTKGLILVNLSGIENMGTEKSSFEILECLKTLKLPLNQIEENINLLQTYQTDEYLFRHASSLNQMSFEELQNLTKMSATKLKSHMEQLVEEGNRLLKIVEKCNV